MTKAELEVEVTRLMSEVSARDRLLRMCWYRVRQLRGPNEDKFISELDPWRPMPREMMPR